MHSVKRSLIATSLLILVSNPLAAASPPWEFALIGGGTVDLDTHSGPALVVNTASLCAFTRQYDALQDLHETYEDQGLLVLAVPSDDFRQELESGEEVRAFCEVNFDLTLPIAEISQVRGPDAHPFFGEMADEYRAAPRWNFTKYLVKEGVLLESWPSSVRPGSRRIIRAIEAALP